MHLSDDILVPWEAMLAWADDTVLLEPLGFQRGFSRIEIMPESGHASLVDQIEGPVNLTTYQRLVHINSTGGRDDPERGQFHYIQLPVMFDGMWAGSRTQLTRFMASRFWTMDGALNAPGRVWGLPEMSECSLHFVDEPQGFDTAMVVPYDPATKRLLAVGLTHHLPSK